MCCCLAALVYSHPLGLLMLAALALAGLVDVRRTFGGLRRWLAVHGAVTILILPWIGNYLDHPPEFVSDRLPLRFLLGTPIGFIGGNSLLLLGLVALVALGIIGQSRDHGGSTSPRRAGAYLLCWLHPPARGPLSLFLVVPSGFRPGAVHGVRGAGIPRASGGGTQPAAGVGSLSARIWH